MFACFLALISACKSTNGSTQRRKSLKPTLGIDMASLKGFALADDSAAARDQTAPQVAYAVDADNNFVAIEVLEATTPEGKPDMLRKEDVVRPAALYDTRFFLFLIYIGLRVDLPEGGEPIACEVVVVRKSDGALFCADIQGMQPPRTNGAGDVVIADSIDGLVRLDLRDPEALTLERLGAIPQAYEVNDSGDILVALADKLRILKSTGGLQNVSTSAIECLTRGLTNAPGDFFYVAQGSEGAMGRPDELHHLSRQSDGQYTDTLISSELTGSFGSSPRCTTVFRSTDRVTVIANGPLKGLIDLVAPADTLVYIPVPLASVIETGVQNGDETFLIGSNSIGDSLLLRVLPATNAQTVVLPAGAYTLSSVSVRADELTFAGLRNSDGHRVVGVVPKGASTPTWWSESAPKITTLVRIR